MSEYNALTGVKKLRVRGFNAVRYCATLKAAGLNLLRAAAVRRKRKRSQSGPESGFLHLFMPFPIVKERIYKLLIAFEDFLSSKTVKTNFYTKFAA